MAVWCDGAAVWVFTELVQDGRLPMFVDRPDGREGAVVR